MIVCIPVGAEAGDASLVYGHFGSAPCFALYDVKSGDLTFVKNDNDHHAHGTCNPMRQLVSMGADCLVTGGIGRRAVEMLQQAGIKVYKADGISVRDVIMALAEDRLQVLDPASACGGHAGGGGHCHD